MQTSMNLCVTILTNQDALVKFLRDPLPGSGVPPGSNTEVFATAVMKHKRIHTAVVATEDTLPSFVGYRSFFEPLSAPGNVVLVLATLAAELALPP